MPPPQRGLNNQPTYQAGPTYCSYFTNTALTFHWYYVHLFTLFLFSSATIRMWILWVHKLNSLFSASSPAPNTVLGHEWMNKWINRVKFNEEVNQPTWWNDFAIYSPLPGAEISEERHHSNLHQQEPGGQKAPGRVSCFRSRSLHKEDFKTMISGAWIPFLSSLPYHPHFL